MRGAVAIWMVLAVGCASAGDGDEASAGPAAPDAGAGRDAAAVGPGEPDAAPVERDAASSPADAAIPAQDAAPIEPDAGRAPDPDAARPSEPDAAAPPRPDGAPPEPDAAPARVLGPCEQGPGFAVWRFRYDDGSTSPRVDAWSASCDYRAGSDCAIDDGCEGDGPCDVGRTVTGAVALDAETEFLRIRFSVAGLEFSEAWVHTQARSLAIAASTTFEVWSPLRGGVQDGPVDNDFVYDWYETAWTEQLQPEDAPADTEIRVRPVKGGALGVQAMELCVR